MALKKIRKHHSIILGVFLLIISFGLFINYYSKELEVSNQEKIDIQNFLDEDIENNNVEDVEQVFEEEIKKEQKQVLVSDYIAVLEIPEINLKKGLVDMNNKYNHVDYNIQIIDSSTLPDVLNGNLILAGHNGSGYTAFFKNLEKLKINDKVYIYYNDVKYEYTIDKKYDTKKDGKVEITRDNNKTTITLITCKNNSNDLQVVYVGYLTDTSKYS